MNVSGHRLSTAEVESALVAHPQVAEAAVVGASDSVTGQAIVAFVILRADNGQPGRAASAVDDDRATLISDLQTHVAAEIGAIAKLRQIIVVSDLPKARSGKIMRRLLREVVEHRELGDVSTLTDPRAIEPISSKLAGTANHD